MTFEQWWSTVDLHQWKNGNWSQTDLARHVWQAAYRAGLERARERCKEKVVEVDDYYTSLRDQDRLSVTGALSMVEERISVMTTEELQGDGEG